MNFHDKLIVLMDKHNIYSFNKLAYLVELPRTTLYSILNGDTDSMRVKTAVKLCNFFDISLDELLNDNIELQEFQAKNKTDKQAIPVLSKIKSKQNYLVSDNYIGFISIDKKLKDPENHFALKVIGDSMQPILYENDIVIVHRQKTIKNGDIGVIIVNNEEATIKKIIKDNTKLTLVSYNAYYPPKIITAKKDYKIIGKVVEARISKVFE